MTRKATMIHTAIWERAEFVERTTQAQLVYLMLVTQPTVAATGLLALTSKKWARYTTGHVETVEAALDELARQAAPFVWLDEAAEELVIRSWIKHNVLGSPKMETAAMNQLDAITSRRLRDLLSAEYEAAVHSSTGERLFPETLSTTPAYPIPPVTTISAQPSQKDTLSRKSDVPRGAWCMEHGERSKENSDVSRARATADTAGRPTPGDTDQVWAAYREYHPRAQLSADRRRLIERRLREWPVETLVAAIRGNHTDPWCLERGHHDLELIIRNADKIERYAAVALHGPRPSAPPSPAGQTLLLAQRLASEGR